MHPQRLRAPQRLHLHVRYLTGPKLQEGRPRSRSARPRDPPSPSLLQGSDGRVARGVQPRKRQPSWSWRGVERKETRLPRLASPTSHACEAGAGASLPGAQRRPCRLRGPARPLPVQPGRPHLPARPPAPAAEAAGGGPTAAAPAARAPCRTPRAPRAATRDRTRWEGAGRGRAGRGLPRARGGDVTAGAGLSGQLPARARGGVLPVSWTVGPGGGTSVTLDRVVKGDGPCARRWGRWPRRSRPTLAGCA